MATLTYMNNEGPGSLKDNNWVCSYNQNKVTATKELCVRLQKDQRNSRELQTNSFISYQNLS